VAFVLCFPVSGSRIRAAWAFADDGGSDIAEELLIKVVSVSRSGLDHRRHQVSDQGQRGEKTEIQRRALGSLGCFGHDPADEVAEHQLGVDFLEDSDGGMGSQVLDIEAVFPFSIDGFERPAAMVKVDQLLSGVEPSVCQGSEQPTGSEPGHLIGDESADQFRRQAGAFASTVGRGMEPDHPVVASHALEPLGKSCGLVRDPHQEVGSPLRDSPESRVGKKSRGRAGEDRWGAGIGSGAAGLGVR
jgi:hypothetical protein